jgi:hypothetical protein
MRARFTVRTCCGDFIDTVTIPVPADFTDESYDRDVIRCAIEEAGMIQHTCEGCGDDAYNVDILDVFA